MNMENNTETTEEKMVDTGDVSVDVPEKIGHSTLYGLLYILLGLFAVFLPSVTSFGVEIILGSILMIQGVSRLFRSIKNRKEGGLAVGILLATITFFSGLFFIQNPLAGVISITALISIYFIVNGILKFLNVFKISKEEGGRIKRSLVALISIAFGFAIWNSVIMSSTLIIGYMLGTLLIIDGIVSIRGKDVKGIKGRLSSAVSNNDKGEQKD